MPKRTANARWEGSLTEGKGTMRMASGAYEGPYSFQSRFEEGDGTNPEELIAAAHAGCFSMALSAELGKAGHEVESVETEAIVHLDKVDEGFAIKRIELRTQATRARHRRRRLPGDRRRREEGLPGLASAGGGGIDRARRAAEAAEGRRAARSASPAERSASYQPPKAKAIVSRLGQWGGPPARPHTPCS